MHTEVFWTSHSNIGSNSVGQDRPIRNWMVLMLLPMNHRERQDPKTQLRSHLFPASDPAWLFREDLRILAHTPPCQDHPVKSSLLDLAASLVTHLPIHIAYPSHGMSIQPASGYVLILVPTCFSPEH